ncbi:hypothetical protein Tco_1455811 [Tanacetum coccineum]
MQFLMGLNDVYQPIRSNILANDSLPDVKDAFNVVSRDESHRGLHFVSGSKVQPASFVVKFNNLKGNDFKRVTNNSNKGTNHNLLCKNYGLTDHTIERCFEITGCPDGFKGNPNLVKQQGNYNFKAFNGSAKAHKSVSTSTGSTSFDTSFTKD